MLCYVEISRICVFCIVLQYIVRYQYVSTSWLNMHVPGFDAYILFVLAALL